MKSITFEGYAVKFCVDAYCDHTDEKVCVNPSGSEFYVPEHLAKKIAQNIVPGTPVVLVHDSKCQVGQVQESWVTKLGIEVRGYVNEPSLLSSVRSQVNIYREQYGKISYEYYFKNLFSSISLSHNPISLHVNHVGLVNIPARTGTEVKYERGKTVPTKKYSCTTEGIQDRISAHLVAFLREPKRIEKLERNGRHSLAAKTGQSRYLQASGTPHKQRSKMPSSRGGGDNTAVIELASQLLDTITGGKRRYRAEDMVDDYTMQQQPKRRRPEPEQPSSTSSSYQQEPVSSRLNEDAIVDKISKNFEKRILEMEENRAREMSSLTEILRNVGSQQQQDGGEQRAIAPESASLNEEQQQRPAVDAIEASAPLTRADRDYNRLEDLQNILLKTMREALISKR